MLHRENRGRSFIQVANLQGCAPPVRRRRICRKRLGRQTASVEATTFRTFLCPPLPSISRPVPFHRATRFGRLDFSECFTLANPRCGRTPVLRIDFLFGSSRAAQCTAFWKGSHHGRGFHDRTWARGHAPVVHRTVLVVRAHQRHRQLVLLLCRPPQFVF